MDTPLENTENLNENAFELKDVKPEHSQNDDVTGTYETLDVFSSNFATVSAENLFDRRCETADGHDLHLLPDKKSKRKKLAYKIAVLGFVTVMFAALATVVVFVSSRNDVHKEGQLANGKRCLDYFLSNGKVVNATGTRKGDSLQVECNSASKLVGSPKITCHSTGHWSDYPRCIPKECNDFEAPPNGKVTFKNESTTIGATVLVMCKEGFVRKGAETVVCQINETWSESPFCEPADCGFPQSIENGEIKNMTGTTYNNTFLVVCSLGYRLSRVSTVVCEQSGMWSEFPLCNTVACGIPGIPKNGHIRGLNGTSFSSTATLQCDEGFFMSGDPTISCTANGSWTGLPTCERNDNKHGLDCDVPSSVENGEIGHMTGTRINGTFLVRCFKGYNLKGNRTVFCGEDGTWSDMPACLPVSCGSPSVPSNGYVVSTNGTTFKASVWISCNKGYYVSGNQEIICMESGQWTAFPTCERKDCGFPSNITNGKIKGFTSTKYNDSFSVDCMDGYILIGQETINCDINGNWTSIPACIVQPNCGVPPSLENGEIIGVTGTKIFYVRCNNGYRLTGESTFSCDMNGKWTTLPTCQLIDCGPPPSIENGRISGHSSSNTFSVQCNDGYIITGERIIKCSLNGKWTALPSCEYLSCGIPEIPRNGMLLKINGTRFNAMATVKCDEGYSLAGNPVLTCQNNASWTMIPRCIQIDCGIPNITYGSIIGSTSTFYGSKIQIACNDGYALKGSDTVQCSIEGQWSTIPTCNVVTCGLPQIPANGAIASIQGTTFNKTALIKCHAGYVINGTDVVTCSSHGNWTESPTCTQDCEVPANITNGVITRQNSTDTFIVLCNHGYILIGNSTVRCDIYGKWMNASVCNPVSCGIPAIPQNRKLVTLSGTSFESTARMECDEGFLMEGSSVITCLRNGSWTWIPACEPIDCGTPKIENGIIGGYKEPTFGSIIYVTCKEGYILIGSNTVQCGRDGKWGLPICKLYPCGLPEIPENGAIDSISGTIYNRTALIACHPGFYMNGTNIVTCSNRGRWTKSPRCTPESHHFGDRLSDCYDIIHLESNTSLSGIYNVTLWKSKAKIQVYCDMDTDGGGWTVFQYRYDGSVDFFNTNAQYENGFGNLSTEFWLGLKYIDEMSLQGKTELRIDLSAADGSTAFEIFQNFYLVAGNRHIRIDKGTGTAGDSGKGLSYNYNLPFSTRDRDPGGGNCAAKCHGAWWYKTCSYVNLNGRYLTPGTRIINGSVTSGMVYLNFKDESLKSSKMMFRRVKKPV